MILDDHWIFARNWRQNAATDADSYTRTKGFGVRELRPTHRHSDAREAEEKSCCEAQGHEEETELAFFLSASLPLRATLPLLGKALPGELVPGEATARNLRAHDSEAFGVGHLAPVVAERLFIKIPEQVERFHADVSSVKLAFHQTPEVLHRVGVDISPRVLYSVIHNGVLVVSRQSVVGLQRVAEQRRTSRNVRFDLPMKFMLAPRGDRERANFTAALNHSEGNSFVLATCAGNNALPAIPVHVPGFAADERLINLNFARQFGSSLVLA
jgi:hypothetical protein